MLHLDRSDAHAASAYATVYLVFALSKAKWKLEVMLPGLQKMSRFTIAGGDVMVLAARLTAVRIKACQGGRPVRILACYEAGLDGHWLHRWLTAQGVICYVVDPASKEVNRRAKTDRIDLDKLMRVFLAYLRGEPRVCGMLHVPSVEEDRKRRTHERERLVEERSPHANRIKALLVGQGIRDVMPRKPGFIASLEQMRGADGRRLPPQLAALSNCGRLRRTNRVAGSAAV